jgi:hypothetical protein
MAGEIVSADWTVFWFIGLVNCTWNGTSRGRLASVPRASA